MSLEGWMFGLATVPGVAAALAGLYLLALAVAALLHRPTTAPCQPNSRLAVVVPGHNEADLVTRCLTSLSSQDYPRDRFELFVIADNCSDATAELARAAGAQVLVRYAPDQRGKGRALRWAMDRILAGNPRLDAFVIVDADSVADEGLLRGLAVQLEAGAEAVQGEYLVLDEDPSPGSRLRSVGFLLFHRVRFSGRARLHLPCNLVGNGMLLARSLVERHPWNAFTGAEDLEYSVYLRLRGVRPVFAVSARVRGPVPSARGAAQVQRERWEGGRLYVVRTALPKLLAEVFKRRRVSLLDAAADLAVPPLGLLAIVSLVGTATWLSLWGLGVTPAWPLVPWLVALGGILGFVMVGLVASGAPAWMYRSLLSTPIFLVRKATGTLRVLRHRPTDTWVRTERPSEIAS
jgi:1,2-diacylglycerol 3-beta-glucosyltransferase